MTTNKTTNQLRESSISGELQSLAGQCGPQDAAFSQGSTIRFDYPAASTNGKPASLKKRRLRVETIRALCWEPLAPITVELDPELPRGSVLVTGHDLDKSAVRSFYLERMERIETVSLWDEHGAGDDSSDNVAGLEAHSGCPLGPAIARVRTWTQQPFRLLAGIVAKSREEFRSPRAKEENRRG